jgi:hypothetical protein
MGLMGYHPSFQHGGLEREILAREHRKPREIQGMKQPLNSGRAAG